MGFTHRLHVPVRAFYSGSYVVPGVLKRYDTFAEPLSFAECIHVHVS